jgi:hypothetical protein
VITLDEARANLGSRVCLSGALGRGATDNAVGGRLVAADPNHRFVVVEIGRNLISINVDPVYVTLIPVWAEIQDHVVAEAEILAATNIGHLVTQRHEWVQLLTSTIGSITGCMVVPQDDDAIDDLETYASQLVAIAAMLRKRPNVVA